MSNFDRQDNRNRSYEDPTVKKLKHWAYILGAGIIIGIILTLALVNTLTYVVLWAIRICVAVFALGFIILILILIYKIHKYRREG